MARMVSFFYGSRAFPFWDRMARGLSKTIQAGRGVYHKTICSLINMSDQSVKPIPELVHLDYRWKLSRKAGV
jgi:hypothetical protein